jgi:hypothetical protein
MQCEARYNARVERFVAFANCEDPQRGRWLIRLEGTSRRSTQAALIDYWARSKEVKERPDWKLPPCMPGPDDKKEKKYGELQLPSSSEAGQGNTESHLGHDHGVDHWAPPIIPGSSGAVVDPRTLKGA